MKGAIAGVRGDNASQAADGRELDQPCPSSASRGHRATRRVKGVQFPECGLGRFLDDVWIASGHAPHPSYGGTSACRSQHQFRISWRLDRCAPRSRRGAAHPQVPIPSTANDQTHAKDKQVGTVALPADSQRGAAKAIAHPIQAQPANEETSANRRNANATLKLSSPQKACRKYEDRSTARRSSMQARLNGGLHRSKT